MRKALLTSYEETEKLETSSRVTGLENGVWYGNSDPVGVCLNTGPILP